MLSTVKGFYDLCIDITDNKNDVKLRKLLTRLHEHGYRTIAINLTINEAILETVKKKKKNTEGSVSPLNKILDEFKIIDNLKNEFDDKLRFLNRLTLLFSDPAKIYHLNQLENFFKKFHIFAVIPKSNSALQSACTTTFADVIVINSQCNGIKMNRKMYFQAIEKGIYFEIQYADLIAPDYRKSMIHYAHLLHTYGKSKNIIISSGAKESAFIRNPYDIINLANILGLNETQARVCIMGQCKRLLMRAEGKRYGKAIFSINRIYAEVMDEDEDEDDC